MNSLGLINNKYNYNTPFLLRPSTSTSTTSLVLSPLLPQTSSVFFALPLLAVIVRAYFIRRARILARTLPTDVIRENIIPYVHESQSEELREDIHSFFITRDLLLDVYNERYKIIFVPHSTHSSLSSVTFPL